MLCIRLIICFSKLQIFPHLWYTTDWGLGDPSFEISSPNSCQKFCLWKVEVYNSNVSNTLKYRYIIIILQPQYFLIHTLFQHSLIQSLIQWLVRTKFYLFLQRVFQIDIGNISKNVYGIFNKIQFEIKFRFCQGNSKQTFALDLTLF